MSADVPIATPPANVAFYISTILNFYFLLRIYEKTNEMMTAEHKEKTVLSTTL